MSVRLSLVDSIAKVFCNLNDFLSTSINYLKIGIEMSNYNFGFIYFSLQFFFFLK